MARRLTSIFFAAATAALLAAGLPSAAPARGPAGTYCSLQQKWTLRPGEAVEGIVAFSNRDVWAAGTVWHEYPQPNEALLLQWNGQQWTRTLPDMGDMELRSIAAWSPDRIWTVGWDGTKGRLGAARWAGSRWRTVPIPTDRRTQNNQLEQVVAVGPDEAWAVGTVYDAQGIPAWPLIEHWHDGAWTLATPPAFANRVIALSSIAASSPRDVWTVGWEYPGRSWLTRAIALHWDGTRWRELPLPKARYVRSMLALTIVRSPAKAFVFGVTDTNPDRGERGRRAPYSFAWNGRGWRPFSPNGCCVTAPARGGGFWVLAEKTVFRLRGGRTDRVAPMPWMALQDASLNALAENGDGTLWLSGSHFSDQYADDGVWSRSVIARYDCRS